MLYKRISLEEISENVTVTARKTSYMMLLNMESDTASRRIELEHDNVNSKAGIDFDEKNKS